MSDNTSETTQKMIRDMFLRAAQEDKNFLNNWRKDSVITLPADHPRIVRTDPAKCFAMFRVLSERKPPYEVGIQEDKPKYTISSKSLTSLSIPVTFEAPPTSRLAGQLDAGDKRDFHP